MTPIRRATLVPSWAWPFAAALMVLGVALAQRYGTNVLHRGDTFDEQYNRIPIENLIRHGWSIATAIDFTETKGPAFIWPYALLGELVGDSLNQLRLISVIFFTLGVVPLLMICRLCGVRGPRLLLVTVFYVLIPQHAVLGQLLMSESSFIFGGLCLMLAFLWGFGESRDGQQGDGEARAHDHRIAGPIIFAVILSILLHARIHAAAFGAAAALVAFQRDRLRSWPWWLAIALAALSRLPLWIRWGGPVSPEYQQMHDVGLRLDSLTYLAAALVPFTAMFLPLSLLRERVRVRVGRSSTEVRSQKSEVSGQNPLSLWERGGVRAYSLALWERVRVRAVHWYLPALGAALGLTLTLIAPVHLDRTTTVKLPDEQFTVPLYQGFAATLVQSISSSHAVQTALIGAMAVLGLASLGALASLSMHGRHAREGGHPAGSPYAKGLDSPLGGRGNDPNRPATALRLQIWTLLAGWSMYALTQGYVFDRFLMSWAVLMPLAWAGVGIPGRMPLWLAALQALALAVMLAMGMKTYLM